MISKFLFATAAAGLFAAHYKTNKRRKLRKEFLELRKAPTFDFDYTRSLNDLPKGTLVALCAEPDIENAAPKKSLYNPKRNILFSVVTGKPPKKPEIKQPETDEKASEEKIDEISSEDPVLIHDHAILPTYFLLNTKFERIRVNFDTTTPTVLFGIKPIADNIPPEKVITSIHENKTLLPSFFRKKPAEFQEIGVDAEEKYVYIGEISPPSANAHDANVKADLEMKVRYVLGEQKEFYLKHLDNKIFQAGKGVKALCGMVIALFLVDRIIPAVIQYQKKTQAVSTEK